MQIKCVSTHKSYVAFVRQRVEMQEHAKMREREREWNRKRASFHGHYRISFHRDVNLHADKGTRNIYSGSLQGDYRVACAARAVNYLVLSGQPRWRGTFRCGFSLAHRQVLYFLVQRPEVHVVELTADARQSDNLSEHQTRRILYTFGLAGNVILSLKTRMFYFPFYLYMLSLQYTWDYISRDVKQDCRRFIATNMMDLIVETCLCGALNRFQLFWNKMSYTYTVQNIMHSLPASFSVEEKFFCENLLSIYLDLFTVKDSYDYNKSISTFSAEI